ncbi:hypothetical protein CKO09_12100 [Chromatium weissei]|nr:hypothetical protein [Chromatium weissei]
MSTFKPGTLSVVRFVGSHKLYRAAGWDAKRGQMASAYGSWWADEAELLKINQKIDMFESWLPEDLLRRAIPAQYRGATALCDDWNDMREMFKLVLPVQDEIEGLVGVTASQPRLSTLSAQSRSTPMLEGGAEQVFFKKTNTLNSVNPLWIYPERLW